MYISTHISITTKPSYGSINSGSLAALHSPPLIMTKWTTDVNVTVAFCSFTNKCIHANSAYSYLHIWNISDIWTFKHCSFYISSHIFYDIDKDKQMCFEMSIEMLLNLFITLLLVWNIEQKSD